MAKVKSHAKEAIAHYRAKAQKALNRALLVGERVAKAETPVETGTARRTVHIEPGPEEPRRITGQIGSILGYFKWIEIGSRGRPGKFPLAKGRVAAKAALDREMRNLE